MTTTAQPGAQAHSQRRAYYEIEKELAARLRQASRAERRQLYHTVYDERLQRMPAHPLLMRAQNAGARARAVAPQRRLVLSFLPKGAVFLELGPGDGALALAVAQHARQVWAVDVSNGLLADGARPANLKFVLSDGIAVPVPKESVHLAYSSQVMEHLHPDDAHEQLVNIHSALVAGGAYLCITPNRLSGPWDVSRGFDPVATGLHLKEYTTGELARQFYEAGFSRVWAFLSYHGRLLTPRLPVAPIAALERGLQRLPPSVRRGLAGPLTAVKVIGYK